MIAAVGAIGEEGQKVMTFDRASPRSAFTDACKARWLFGDEAAAQCFNNASAATQDVLDVAKIFAAAVVDGRIPIYDAVSGEGRFSICPQEELIETFVILMAEEANRDPWPTTPPMPWYAIDLSDVEQFIDTWLKDTRLDDMRLDGTPSQPPAAVKDARRQQTDIHFDKNIILLPAPAIKRRLLRLSEVKRVTALSKSAIYARMKDADFPKQKNLGP
jgi:Prophage CP4-57 regulatory protein (AlpA)